MVEVSRGIADHPNAAHNRLGPGVGRKGEGHHFRERLILKGKRQRTPGGFARKSVTPGSLCQSPADFNRRGEGSLEGGPMQAGVANELLGVPRSTAQSPYPLSSNSRSMRSTILSLSTLESSEGTCSMTTGSQLIAAKTARSLALQRRNRRRSVVSRVGFAFRPPLPFLNLPGPRPLGRLPPRCAARSLRQGVRTPLPWLRSQSLHRLAPPSGAPPHR